MKIKLSQIVNSVESLKALLEVKLPVKVSYKLSRLVNKLNGPLEEYNKKRNDLIKEYGEEDPETKNWSVKDAEKLKLFVDKITELLSVEEEIEWFEPISISDLGSAEIAPKDLIEWIFTDNA